MWGICKGCIGICEGIWGHIVFQTIRGNKNKNKDHPWNTNHSKYQQQVERFRPEPVIPVPGVTLMPFKDLSLGAGHALED